MVARIDASVEVVDPEVTALRARAPSRTTAPRLAVVSPRAGVQAETAAVVEPGPGPTEQAAIVDTQAVEPVSASANAGTSAAAGAPAPAAPLPAAAPGVTEQWAQDRRAAMEEVRAEYRAARDQAERSGQFMRTETQTDESGSYEIRVFDEASFRAQWLGQAQGSVQALAGLYGLDQGALVGGRSDVIDLALRGNVGLYEGRAPDGHVMASAAEIADLDAYLYSDMNQVLILQFGTEPVAPATSGLAQEQVRKYGQVRYEMLARLEQAQRRIQRDYADALAQARNDPSRQAAGWHDVQVQVQVGGVADESGNWLQAPETRTVTERRFDVQAFSTWYVSQPQVSNQAFGAMYGIGHEVEVPGWADESGNAAPSTYEVRFTVQLGGGQTRELTLSGDRIVDPELVHIDLNRPPDLHDGNGVAWNPLLGWSTHNSNIDRGRDWFEVVFSIVIVAVVAYVSAGTLGAWAAGVAGGGFAGAVAAGAVVGATTAMASGVINGNFSWSNVLKGMVLGGIGGGISYGVGELAQSAANTQLADSVAANGGSVNYLDTGNIAHGTQTSYGIGRDMVVEMADEAMQNSLITDAQNTFNAVRSGGTVVQGGLMAEIGGGDFEDGALGSLGAVIGQGAASVATRAFSGDAVQAGDQPDGGFIAEAPPASAGAQFAGSVVGAGVTSVMVDAQGGDGDLAFANAVVNSAVNLAPQIAPRESTPPEDGHAGASESTWSTDPDDYAGLEDAFGEPNSLQLDARHTADSEDPFDVDAELDRKIPPLDSVVLAAAPAATATDAGPGLLTASSSRRDFVRGMAMILRGSQTGPVDAAGREIAERERQDGLALIRSAIEDARSDPRIAESLASVAGDYYSRWGISQQLSYASTTDLMQNWLLGDGQGSFSITGMGGGFNAIAGPGRLTGSSAASALLLSALAGSGQSVDSIVARVDRASSATYGELAAATGQALPDGVEANRRLWDSPALNGGDGVAAVWGASVGAGRLTVRGRPPADDVDFVGPPAPQTRPAGQFYRTVDTLDEATTATYAELNALRSEFLAPRVATGRNPNVTYSEELHLTGRPRELTVNATGDRVALTPEGNPIFGPYLYDGPLGVGNVVRIRMTGNYNDDFAAANRAAGFSQRPDGYTWHHTEELGVLQLVPQQLHNAIPHSGGVSFYNALVDAGRIAGPKYPRR